MNSLKKDEETHKIPVRKRMNKNSQKFLTNTDMAVEMVENKRVHTITHLRPFVSPKYPHI